MRASVTFIDPRDADSYMEASSDFLTEKGEILRSYGMFDMDFRSSLNKELNVRNVSFLKHIFYLVKL